MIRNQHYHISDQRYCELSSGLLKKAVNSKKITQDEADLISKYSFDELENISQHREYAIVDLLILNREFFPNYTIIKTVDVQTGMRNMKNAVKPDGTPRFKRNSLIDRIKAAKRFFIWMANNGYDMNLDNEKLNKISPPASDRITKTSNNILDEGEMEKFLSAIGGNTRDKALFALLYEAGLRPRELADLTWGDLKFTEWNVVCTTAGKTGKSRYIPLVISRQYLANWRNNYPQPETADSFVFVKLRKDSKTGTYLPISYKTLQPLINKYMTKAGITKKITPHCFRHSKITNLLREGCSEAHIKKMMWGSTSTNMIPTYEHLVNNDMDEYVAKMYGIKIQTKEEKKKIGLQPRQCERCATINSPTSKYCEECGAPLTDEGIDKTELNKKELLEMLKDVNVMMEFQRILSEYQSKV